jgi:general stress protein 26
MNIRKRVGRALLDRYKRKKQEDSDLSLENCWRAIDQIVDRTKYCFLITQGIDYRWPSARLVEPIANLDSFTFYIGTNPDLRKVQEIQNTPEVTLAYGNQRDRANLIVHGIAQITSDPELRRSRWKGTWRLFFPQGPLGDDYVVIEVKAERIELLSFSGNVVPEPFGLKPVVLMRRESGWVVES